MGPNPRIARQTLRFRLASSLSTGVHRNYIGGIERGERSPTVATVAVLADALGVSMGELFTRSESLALGRRLAEPREYRLSRCFVLSLNSFGFLDDPVERPADRLAQPHGLGEVDHRLR